MYKDFNKNIFSLGQKSNTLTKYKDCAVLNSSDSDILNVAALVRC